MVCPAMKCSSDFVPVRVQLDALERDVCPGKNGAPTGFALGCLGKKGVNSDFISIHEEPPVYIYSTTLTRALALCPAVISQPLRTAPCSPRR